MDHELEEMIRKKNDYIKKIQDQKRMMDLINNPISQQNNTIQYVQGINRNITIKVIQVRKLPNLTKLEVSKKNIPKAES